MRRAFVVVAGLFAVTSCRKCGGDEGAPPDAPVEVPSEPMSTASSGPPHAARDAQPGIDDARLLDGGASEPACTGAEVDLAAALFDPRCAIGSSAAKKMSAALEDGGAPVTLKQEAKLLPDGHVLVRLSNTGKVPLALPLSFHPKVATFTALAEDEANRAIYELEPPRLEPPDGGAFEPGARFARVVLVPGAAGVARATVGASIVKRIAPSCEAGTCAPPALTAGKYVLHIGQLLVDVEAGAPAELAWQVR